MSKDNSNSGDLPLEDVDLNNKKKNETKKKNKEVDCKYKKYIFLFISFTLQIIWIEFNSIGWIF